MKRILIVAALINMIAGCDRNEKQLTENRTQISVSKIMGNQSAAGFEQALAPQSFNFPQDHGPHPGFGTEWWYFTGNMLSESGDRFGFQFTIFRNALSPHPVQRSSRWAAHQFYMGHFAVTLVEQNNFSAFERFARSANGLAGAKTEPLRIWLEDWEVNGAMNPAADRPSFKIRAEQQEVAIQLKLESRKPVVLQGENGWSRKGPQPGNASYYYSLPRLAADGIITVNNKQYSVRGEAWLDREWSTSALGEDQVGWDWFSLQLSDTTEVMYYQLRHKDGSPDSFSSGIRIYQNGETRRFSSDDVTIDVLKYWQSPRGSNYPVQWQLAIPNENLFLKITPLIKNQELNLTVRYWEGAVRVDGQSDENEISGFGYVELTGYADSSLPR